MRVRVEKEKKIRGRVERERAKKLSKRYNKLACYLVQFYDPQIGAPVGVIPVRTQPTLESVLKDLEELGLYPLILPQPVYVPASFWERYRGYEDKDRLVREYGLLRDSSIYRFETVVIDVDSPFESVYPVWSELKERVGIRVGYQVYRTKSGRFRAYVYLLDGTKDLRRAKELVAIIYAFFEKKGLRADPTFVYRLNHPVFYEDFPLYSYELVEEEKGRDLFFRLYRRGKELQKKLNLYEFDGKNLTEWIWGKKPSAKKGRRKKRCKILKAPAFVRKLEMEILDVLELWKRRVATLARKRDSYRYIYVIQPAIGWAKYLNLPEDEVTEFLVELLGEEKRKDVEKGWRYARELVFEVPERIEWSGRTREEWEGVVLRRLRREKEVSRQELLKKDFYNQKWLCDLVMDGLEKKGIVVSEFVRHGRGRPKKVYRIVEIERIPIRKAVGCETIIQAGLELSCSGYNKEKFVVGEEKNLAIISNSLSLRERAMGGGWLSTGIAVRGSIVLGSVSSCSDRVSNGSSGVSERLSGGFESGGKYSDIPKLGFGEYVDVLADEGVCMSGKSAVDEVLYSLLQQSRAVFNLVELSGKVRKGVWLLSYSLPKRILVLSDGSVSLQDVGRISFTGRNAVKFFKEVFPELSPSEGLSFAEGKKVFIYPYAAGWEKWELLRHYPYFLVLHKAATLKGKRPRKVHEYSVVYKLSLSAFTVFNPYPKSFISEGEPVAPHEAGVWREGAKEITKLMIQEFKSRKVSKLLVTLALKDGREITGVINRGKLSGFYYLLSNPDNEKEKVFVLKHAVDDFWLEE